MQNVDCALPVTVQHRYSTVGALAIFDRITCMRYSDPRYVDLGTIKYHFINMMLVDFPST
jgi:hypothetical protein